MSLLESMQAETVSSLSLRPAIRCVSTDTVRVAVQRMREGKLGCAVIVDDGDRPIGLFTEAMLRQQLLTSPDCVEKELASQMAVTVPWVKTSDPVETVLDTMEVNNTRFLVVVDDEGKVVGVTGQKGLMEFVAEYFPGEVMVQRVARKAYSDQREGA